MDERRSALIIANSDYEDARLRQLVAPARDADALERVLTDPDVGGFKVTTLLNRPAREVGVAIQKFFLNRKRDDLLLLYYSGHGLRDDDGQLYLTAVDTHLIEGQRPLLATAIGASLVRDSMRDSGSRRKVLVLDCCYSGALAKAWVAKGGPALTVHDQFEEGHGLVLLTASSAVVPAFEGEGVAGSSLFTHHLVEGIETGEADRDGDGLISLDELYDYVHDQVTNENPQQVPKKWPFDVEGEIVIAKVPEEIVKACELPDEVQQAIDSTAFVGLREDAVRQLGRLLRGKHKGRAVAAREALLRLKGSDDSLKVRNAAARCLAEYEGEKRQRLRAEAEREKAEQKRAEADESAPASAIEVPVPPPPAVSPLQPKESPTPGRNVEVFFSYSHKDESLRDELHKHLAGLRRQGLISEWHDRKIGVGQVWADAIDHHLNTADVILLLISADFVASEYCFGREMTRALERHERGEAVVVPIILRPVYLTGTPFMRLQALPRDARPVTTWPNVDEALADVAKGIRAVVEEVAGRLKAEAERAAQQKAKRERQQRERAEEERQARERAKQERLAHEKAEAERRAAEEAAAQRAAQEKAEQEWQERERAEEEARERAEQERLAREKAEAERRAAEEAAAQRAAEEKAEQERRERAKAEAAERERVARERAEAERRAAEEAAARRAAQQAGQERLARERQELATPQVVIGAPAPGSGASAGVGAAPARIPVPAPPLATPGPVAGDLIGGSRAEAAAGAATPASAVAEARDLIEEMAKQLAPGRMLYNPPEEMKVGLAERIEARIDKGLTQDLAAGLKGRGVPRTEEIRVGPFMKVRLTGTSFDIRSLTHEEQLVAEEGFTQWAWDVTPLKFGPQVLSMLVTVRIKIPDYSEEFWDYPVFDKQIKVHVNIPYTIREFIRRYWQWLAYAVIIPTLVWSYGAVKTYWGSQAAIRQGDSYLAKRAYKEALNAYQTGLDRNPGNAVLRARVQQTREAIAARQNQIELLISQGDSHYATHAYREAIGEYQKAHTLDPENPIPRERLQRAREALNQQVRDLMNQGDSYYKQGAYAEAIRKYQAAQTLDPDNPAPREKIQQVHDAASGAVKKKVSNLIRQGDSYYRSDAYDKALRAYQDGLNLEPENRDLQEKASRARGKQIDSLTKRGASYYQNGQYANAIAEYQRALALDPNNPELTQRIRDARSAWDWVRRHEGPNN